MFKSFITFLSLLVVGFSCNNGEIDFDQGYKYYYNGSKNYLTLNDSIIINSKIIDYDYNDKHILIYKIIQKEDILKEGVYELYIIDKNKNINYGPLTFDDFINLRQKLKIDETLELEIKI